MKRFAASLASLWLFSTAPAAAQSTDAVIRVVDIGAGLCVVATAPGGAMLYDAGRGGTLCRDAVRAMVPGRRLDLVVLSHSDVDHIRELPAILGENTAAVIIHPGDPRGPALDPVHQAIRDHQSNGARVFNLTEIDNPPSSGPGPTPIRPGDSFAVGSARATFIAGWSNGNQTRGRGEAELNGGPMHNALSIVIRFEYGGHSVLLTGDTVGRMIGNSDTRCAYAERIMSGRSASVPIDSDVLVGQHHGAQFDKQLLRAGGDTGVRRVLGGPSFPPPHAARSEPPHRQPACAPGQPRQHLPHRPRRQ